MSLFSRKEPEKGDVVEIIPPADEIVNNASSDKQEPESTVVEETVVTAEPKPAEPQPDAAEDEAMLNFAISQENEEQKRKTAQAEKQTSDMPKDEAPEEEEPEEEPLGAETYESKPYEEDTAKTGKAVRGFILALIMLTLIFGAYNLGKSGLLENNLKPGSVTAIPTLSPKPTEATVFTVVDLNEYVSRLDAETTKPFKASVEKVYGYEYLCLKSTNISIYYRNEYPVDYTGKKTILVDNGIFRTEMYFDYDLTGEIRSLVPILGSYANDDSRQLIFIDYDNYPAIWIIDADKLFNYGCVDFEEGLKKYYKVSFAENPLAEDASRRYIMYFEFASTTYSYAVSKETFVTGENTETDTINFVEDFKLELTDAGITFTTQVKSANNEYLGKISGSVSKNDSNFKLSGVKYGTYAIAAEAGYGEDGLIKPRTSELPTYVTIIGKTGQRYYLPISDEIQRISIDWANIVQTAAGTYEYVVDGEVKSIMGIDVSKYQGDIDWEKVKEAGVEFVIIRLGYRGMMYGSLELDEYYKRNVEGATAAGLKVGVYFFSEAITVDEAIEEAEFVFANIKDYDITYPVVFDTEDIATSDARANNLTFELRTEICRAFCDTIKEFGYTPMIYANSRFMLTAIDLKKLDDIDRWFAYYGTTSQFPYSFTMFQYSESGKIDGIPVNVDLDICFVDYSKKE